MGTSSSYGGSGSSEWSIARDAVDALPGAGAPGPGGEELPDAQRQSLDAALDAVLLALQRGDSDRGSPPRAGYPLSSLLARSRSGGGGSASSAGPGRLGGGSRRQVVKGASRGAAAVAGAYALRNGDAAQLRELGLDLGQLRTLGPRAQIATILQSVLGDAGHPDETALRKATAEHVKAIILAPVPPSPEDSLRGLIAAWIYQLALVELNSQHAKAPLSPQDAVRKQQWLRSWLNRRIRDIAIPDARRMTIGQFSNAAAKVTGEALRMLRAGRS